MFDFRGLLTQILGRQRQYHEQQELGAGQESSEVIIHQPRRSSSQWQKENGELDEMHEYCCCHDLLVSMVYTRPGTAGTLYTGRQCDPVALFV